MALSSSSSSRSWRFDVFLSFHGPDVRTAFLSHLRKQIESNGIKMFNDEMIERGKTIGPELVSAIQESRVSVIVLSQKYASSSWCLDELVEILKCEETAGQIVMTVFYKVKPGAVRKQIGIFGKAFKETCKGKATRRIQNWTKALTHVANIEGEHTLNWRNEANMISKIARDISNKLNATPSKDFDGMVGLEAHLRKMQSLLHLENDGAMIVGISGPAGIGKTTIARALYSKLFCNFPLRYFMENVRGKYRSIECDEYGLKLHLQEQLLSEILDQKETKICHLNVMCQRLSTQKVLIVLDDVDHLEQLEALANETTWFGPGSRIIVTTEDQEILRQHGINNTYHVDFPSDIEATKIFCLAAFKKNSPPNGFDKHAERAAMLCDNLPLGLHVVGSSLRSKKEKEWEDELHGLETILNRNIEKILRSGYDKLQERDQNLFLHIAVFFSYTKSDHLKAMVADINEREGLKSLADKSLISISKNGDIMMHKLLQQVGTQTICRQEPWKRHILIDPHEICDVLQYEAGTRTVSGISFDISDVDEVIIGKGAFKRMPNLRFLRVYRRFDRNIRVQIPEKMEFPCRLRLLHWEEYPRNYLPPTFHPEHLVELDMKFNKLEKLWEGTQTLANLKKMDLSGSWNLKELPDLSKATNLEDLDLKSSYSLVEIPSCFSNLHKLKELKLMYCTNLQVIPDHLNMASLNSINLIGCSKLINFPQSITHRKINSLLISGCSAIKSLPEMITTELMILTASGCHSLQRVPSCFRSTQVELNFSNCFELSQEARRSIIQESFLDVPIHLFWTWRRYGWACLPGDEVPAEFFNHRAKGKSLTIRPSDISNNRPLDAFATYKLCVVISPNQEQRRGYSYPRVSCHRTVKGHSYPTDRIQVYNDYSPFSCLTQFITPLSGRHLFVFLSALDHNERLLAASDEIVFEFSSESPALEITECGAQIWGENTVRIDIEQYNQKFQKLIKRMLSKQISTGH